MAPPTAGEDTSNPDSDDPPEVAVALDEADDGLADAIESALAGRSAIVAVGVPLALLPDTRRERAPKGRNMAGRLSAGVADALWPGVRLRHRGRRGGRGGSDRASDGRGRTRRPANSVRVAGPNRRGRRTGEGSNTRYRGGAETSHARGRAVRERFAAATPETVDMPARSRLLAAACETLDDRFADDVAAVLDAPRTARSDGPVRSPTGRSSSRWRRATITCCGTCGGGSATEQTGSAEGVGIAAGQDLTDDRRALVRAA